MLLQHNFLDPECPDIPKIQLIYHNLMCMVNRNHPGFGRNMRKFALPQGMDQFQFGQYVWERLFTYNEFDPTEQIQFEDDFRVLPMPTLARPRGYTPVAIDDTIIDFPVITEDLLRTYLTFGDYAIQCAHK